MIHLIIVRNPFNPKQRDIHMVPYKPGKTVADYVNEPGRWIYTVDGAVVDKAVQPKDEAYIVAMPYVGKKFLGVVLSIGLAVATSGIMGATHGIFGGMNLFWKSMAAMAIGMIGNMVISKFTAVRPDMTNSTEQSTTYGWGGAKTLTGQGYPLAVTYGTMKSGGVLLSRHVISDGDKQYLNLLYCAGEGPLDEIRDIRIGENPIGNYKDVQVDIRYGTNDQTVIPNFNDNYADQSLNYELTNEWSTQQIQGDACEGIELAVSFPNGLYYSNDSGGMDKTSVILEAQIRKVGDTIWNSLPLANNKGVAAFVEKVDKFPTEPGREGLVRWLRGRSEIRRDEYRGVISEATNTAMYRVFRFDRLEKAKYEVRMRCAHKDGTTLRYVNRVYWGQLTQILYDDFVHPGKALIGVRALATSQLSGSDPEITWIQVRRTVNVWNPYKNAYDKMPADNPAWACYDILHQCKTIGSTYDVQGVPARRIDYDAFKDWAEKCTAGGFTFNYIYDSAGRLWDALKYPETIGRGKVIPRGTRFTCVCDYATMPVQLFSVGNIKQDSFSEAFQSQENRANCVEISFINKDKAYERDVIPVYSDTYDASDSLQSPTQIELMGCTSLEQAYKHGRHFLRCNAYEVRTVTIEAFVDAIACTIGDVILIQHDVPEWGEGGRVASVEGQTIVLDKTVETEPGKTYKLLIRNSETDAVETYAVMAVVGNRVTVKELPGQIANESLYAFGEVNKVAKPFRVLSITKSHSEQTRKITAIEYYEELYRTDGDQVPTIIPDVTKLGVYVRQLSLTKSIVTMKDGTVTANINLRWVLPRNQRAVEVRVYYKPDSASEYTLYATVDGSETQSVIPNVPVDNYSVRVVCVNEVGQVGTPVTQTIYIAGKELPPSDVTGVKAVQDRRNSSVVQLSWSSNPESDISGYKVYEGDTVLVDHTGSTGYTTFISRSGTYTYGVKAIDTSGNESLHVATVTLKAVVNDADIQVPNKPATGVVRLTGKTVRVEFDAVTNTYIDYYEIRTNQSAGNQNGLVGKTNSTIYDVADVSKLQGRAGTIYILAHSPQKGYSAALAIAYSFPASQAPTVKAISSLGGLTVQLSYMEADKLVGANVYIDGKASFYSLSGQLFIPLEGGVYTLQVAMVDVFGEGVRSIETNAAVRAQIPSEYINQEELGLKEMQKNIKLIDEQLASIPDTVDKSLNSVKSSITSINDELSTIDTRIASGAKSSLKGDISAINSRITQLDGAIDVKVANGVKEVNSRVTQLSDSVSSAVNAANGANTRITQLSESLSSTVKKTDTLSSQITQMGTSITALVTKTNDSSSQIMQLSNTITSTVKDVNGVKTSITQLTKSIDSKVANSVSGLSSRITQLDNGISIRITEAIKRKADKADLAGKADKDKIISQINLSKETVKIDGKYIHITGTTKFDDNVIVNKMIAAKSITADKMSINSLSAITANLGTVYGGEIIGTKIRNDSGSFSVDSDGTIRGVKIVTGTLNADIIRQAGYQLKRCIRTEPWVWSGEYIPIPAGYSLNLAIITQCSVVDGVEAHDKNLNVSKWLSIPITGCDVNTSDNKESACKGAVGANCYIDSGGRLVAQTKGGMRWARSGASNIGIGAAGRWDAARFRMKFTIYWFG